MYSRELLQQEQIRRLVVPDGDSLTEQQRAILVAERRFWRTAGAKEDAIREMGLTVTRYYQLANQLLDSPAAMAADPVTVKRLQRIRSRRHSSLAHAGSSRHSHRE